MSAQLERLNNLRAEMLAAVEKAKAFDARAIAEKRAMTAEEQTSWDAAMADYDTKRAEFDGLNTTHEREKRAEEAERFLSTSQGRRAIDRGSDGRTPPGAPVGTTVDLRGIPGGERYLSGVDPSHPRLSAEVRTAFNTYLMGGQRALTDAQYRALQADNPTEGGFLVAPMQFVSGLLKGVDDMTTIRNFATVTPLDQAESLGVVSLDTDLGDADWTTELATGTEDTALRFGRRELRPNPMAKLVKVSKKLMRQSNIDQIVLDRNTYKFGITQEKAHMTGSGSNQPLGIFTASAQGISTGADTTAASATVIAGDDLINVQFAMKSQYWTRSRWFMHRLVLKAIRQLKDTTSNYLWSPGLGPGGGLTNGLPPTILDRPYSISEYAPSTIATGQYVAVLCDPTYYWIADALNMEIQVLTELYAATNQTGFISRMESDGMPVLEEAFRRLKMA